MSNSRIGYTKLIWNQPQPETSRKRMVIFLVSIILLVVGFMLFNQFASNKPQYVLPPKYNTENQTFDKVVAFIKSDDTNTMPYGEGFNCVNFVFRVWGNAMWQGIMAVPIVIQYEEPPGHMVIGFPTTDRGDVFFETENDQQIKLKVGSNYGGRKIRGFYAMDTIFIPLANSPEYDPSIAIK